MREKICDLIYLDSGNYISLESLRILYWAIAIIPITMMIIGIAGKILFPILSIVLWSLLYWIFILALQSKRTKKTFRLRFLVNGISGFLISSLFWIFFASFNLASDTPFLKFDFFLWIPFFYLLFSLIYIFTIVFCVHRGVFSRIKEKSQTKNAIMISGFLGSLIPISGVIGMYASRLIHSHASINTQHSVMAIFSIFLIFLPALAHINFVQFYYCKKYGIDCDEHGNNTSPELERKPKKDKKSKHSTKKPAKKSKKKLPLILRILIGIACVPIAAFILLFLIVVIINL